MRSVLMFLAAFLAALLVADVASAGSRHTGHGGAHASFNFNFNGGYYARPSALLFVRTVPAYGYADACAPAPVPVPVAPVPPLALNFRDVSDGCVGASSAAPSYSYGSSFAFRSAGYDYGSAHAARQAAALLAYERELNRQRGFGRRAAPSGNGGSGIVGILGAAARTVRNVAGAVIGGR